MLKVNNNVIKEKSVLEQDGIAALNRFSNLFPAENAEKLNSHMKGTLEFSKSKFREFNSDKKMSLSHFNVHNTLLLNEKINDYLIKNDVKSIANLSDLAGKCYDKSLYSKACEICLAILPFYQKVKNIESEAHAFQVLGKCYFKMEDVDSARKYYAAAEECYTGLLDSMNYNGEKKQATDRARAFCAKQKKVKSKESTSVTA